MVVFGHIEPTLRTESMTRQASEGDSYSRSESRDLLFSVLAPDHFPGVHDANLNWSGLGSAMLG